MAVHPTAVVAAGAAIDPSAEIGPFCVVGAHAVVGADTRLLAHVVLQGRIVLGRRNVVHPFACLGGAPQDRKYRGEPSSVALGDDNVIREGVTINAGTEAGCMHTQIGSNCLVMAYAHVAHDCTLGDGVILANGVGLAGHVHIDDNATIGGLAAVHQHCRIGRLAFIGGGSMVARDVLPFVLAQGDRAELAGLNVVGLRRHGFGRDRVLALRQAYAALFAPQRTRDEALAYVAAELAPASEEVAEWVAFAQRAQRGLCAPRRLGAPLAERPKDRERRVNRDDRDDRDDHLDGHRAAPPRASTLSQANA